MYQNFQQNSFQPQMSSGNVTSQYRGLETRYQPVGMVQSQYNQSINSNMGNQQQNQSSNQFSNIQSPQSYHTASYRGNQQGHDTYLRSDSNQPAQQQYASSYISQAPSFNSNNNFESSYSTQQYAQQSPDSFHTANYRGNQQGHDSYLRSDSSQPAQIQYGMGTANMNSYNAGMSNSYSSQQFSQVPQSYHTANYRGNQQGHDAYLRSDSTQPAQSQYGMSSFGMNRSQF
ncbi:hypothetical protein [Paenibacillus sp. UNC451MF]|uniref:hypothetical protein n=1 Tax=Paenibacillus sp. UNC451MF TaxID=1449063 RepID=UPI0004917954|nr:hypothetical protein [Paenibacillus sp. UNC451MF]